MYRYLWWVCSLTSLVCLFLSECYERGFCLKIGLQLLTLRIILRTASDKPCCVQLDISLGNSGSAGVALEAAVWAPRCAAAPLAHHHAHDHAHDHNGDGDAKGTANGNGNRTALLNDWPKRSLRRLVHTPIFFAWNAMSNVHYVCCTQIYIVNHKRMFDISYILMWYWYDSQIYIIFCNEIESLIDLKRANRNMSVDNCSTLCMNIFICIRL